MLPDALIGPLTILCVAALACLPLLAVYGGEVDWTRDPAALAAWEGTATETETETETADAHDSDGV